MMKKTIAILSLLLAFQAKAQNGDWSGKLEVQGTSLTVVVHITDEGCTLDSPDQGALGIKGNLSKNALGGIRIDIPSIDAVYEGFPVGEKLIGTFIQHGTSFPLTLSPGIPVLRRPQTPQPPFPYLTEDISFANGEAVLRGTLTIPQDCGKDTPVVLMVTGSGLQNRDEELFGHRPFAVIADALARCGIASLRYDDRGFGESSGDAMNATIEDLKEDALAGLAFLRECFSRAGVLGHSEGGTIALMLAAEKQIDFAVSLAGMVISGKETLIEQNRLMLPHSGYSEQMTEEYCKALEEVFDCVIDGITPSLSSSNLPAELKQNLQAVAMLCRSPYMKHFIKLDLTSRLDSISCPVLALNGTSDRQVDCKRNLDALENGLKCPHKTFAAEGLNHMFQHCMTGFPEEYKDIEETFSSEALKIICDWILKL